MDACGAAVSVSPRDAAAEEALEAEKASDQADREVLEAAAKEMQLNSMHTKADREHWTTMAPHSAGLSFLRFPTQASAKGSHGKRGSILDRFLHHGSRPGSSTLGTLDDEDGAEGDLQGDAETGISAADERNDGGGGGGGRVSRPVEWGGGSANNQSLLDFGDIFAKRTSVLPVVGMTKAVTFNPCASELEPTLSPIAALRVASRFQDRARTMSNGGPRANCNDNDEHENSDSFASATQAEIADLSIADFPKSGLSAKAGSGEAPTAAVATTML